MKQLIILTASLILGLALFGLIAGRQDSVYSTAGNVWKREVQQRELRDAPLR